MPRRKSFWRSRTTPPNGLGSSYESRELARRDVLGNVSLEEIIRGNIRAFSLRKLSSSLKTAARRCSEGGPAQQAVVDQHEIGYSR